MRTMMQYKVASTYNTATMCRRMLIKLEKNRNESYHCSKDQTTEGGFLAHEAEHTQ